MLSLIPSVFSGGFIGSAFNKVLGKGNQLMEYGALYGATQGVIYAVVLDRTAGMQGKLTPRQFMTVQMACLLAAAYGGKKIMEWKWEFSPSLSLQISFFGVYVYHHKNSLGVER